jgi:hypothetical protein
MNLERADLLLVQAAVRGVASGRERTVRHEDDCIYVENGRPRFPYVRLRQLAPTQWQLEELGGGGAVLRWVRRARGSLTKLLDRWNDRDLLMQDLRISTSLPLPRDRTASGVAAARSPQTLAADAVFPALHRAHEDGWEGSVTLDAWRGFACRWDEDGRRVRRSSSGRCLLVVVAPDESAPTEAQRKAFSFLKAHEPAIARRVNAKILAHYRALRPELLAAFDDTDPAIRRMLAPAASAEALRDRIQIHTVRILRKASQGVAQVGLELSCVWGGEHGLGVRLHQDRVVAIGHADAAF